ncbi:hypothetical protein RIF29_35972 [Crotalaria pallida]|uniref:Uncharacterized protein n=1 Tax=Crotalaria pallida TaxID=3830 RepID=A0AAN9EAK1_CROPI
MTSTKMRTSSKPSTKARDSRFEGRELVRYTRDQLLQLREGGPAPTLVKAEVPWSARKGTLSDKDRVLKTVKGILNKLTPEKFDLLKGVISLIFDKAVLEPTFCMRGVPIHVDITSKQIGKDK